MSVRIYMEMYIDVGTQRETKLLGIIEQDAITVYQTQRAALESVAESSEAVRSVIPTGCSGTYSLHMKLKDVEDMTFYYEECMRVVSGKPSSPIYATMSDFAANYREQIPEIKAKISSIIDKKAQLFAKVASKK